MTHIKKFAWYGSSVALAALLAVTLLVSGPMSVANAANSVTASVAADGIKTSTVTIDTTSGTYAAGDQITLTTDLGTFANGQASQTKTVATGAAALTWSLKSSVAGKATVTGSVIQAADASNQTVASQTVTFYGAPSVSDADTLFAVGSGSVKNITVAEAVATGEAVTFHIEDANDRDVSGAPYTLTVTGGATFSASGTATASGLTSSTGDIGTATNLTIPTGAFSGVITLVVKAATGTITLTGPIVKAGPASTSTFAVTTAFKDVEGRVALDDQDGALAVGNITTKDSAGTKVDPTGTASVSCTGTDVDGLALIATSTITVAGSDGTSPVTIDPADTKGGIAACTWNIAAVTGTNAEPAATGTFDVVVSIATIVTVQVTVDANVNPGVPVSVVVDLLDANGNRVQSGAPAETVTVAVNGTSGGNLIVGGSAVAHTNGRVTATFVPGDTLGNYTVTAVTSNASPKTGFAVVTVKTVSTTTPPPAGEGTFTGTITASGVSLVVFNGGTVADLAAAGHAAGLTSVSLTVDGKFVVYIIGAPSFVNALFNAAFADGIAASTPVIVQK